MADMWRDYALCAGVNPEIFFSDTQRSNDTRKALQICAACPVKRQCREFAIKTASDYGVWGGTTAKARRPSSGRPRGIKGSRRSGRPEHGDKAGAQRHRRAGTEVCPECLAAEREASRERTAAYRSRNTMVA